MAGILKKKLTKTLLISLFISVIAILLMFSGFLNTWESKISDAFYYPSNVHPDIYIVEIDDDSIENLGGWPLTRDHYATVIDNLNNSLVIGIDILFDTPREGDSEFADAINRSNVVLAVEYKELTTRSGEIYAGDILEPNESLGENYTTGFVNLHTDEDKVTRSISPVIKGQQEHEPFSAAIVRQLGLPPDLGSSRMLIKFYSAPRGYNYVSFYTCGSGSVHFTISQKWQIKSRYGDRHSRLQTRLSALETRA